MARAPKADYVPLMIAAARRRIEAGEEVSVTRIAEELEVSPGLVHFYFGDRQSLVDAAWREILMAYVNHDLGTVSELAEEANWDGIHELVRQIFSPERDDIHLAHVAASVEATRSEVLADTFAEATAVTVESWKALMEAGIEMGLADTALDTETLGLMFMALPLGVTAVRPDLSAEQREHLANAWTAMIRAVLDPTYVVPRRQT
ncbi:MAG: TetR/AcrR family transcriptional regulator [Acidimicrobiales bacterium]